MASGAAPALMKDAPVQVREVAWDRLQSGLKELEAEQGKSDVSPADWSAQRKAGEKAKLLKVLQVSEEPASVEVLGRSDFRSTTPLRPESSDQPELLAMARKVGANKVVWSRRLVGQADTIVREPMTTFESDHRGRRVFSESSTTWVPLSVRADQYAYVAYFLRTGALAAGRQ